MLAVSPLRSAHADGEERVGEMGGFADEFSFDDIDFSDLFVGFDDGDILPDLEVDPAEILAGLSAYGEEEDSSGMTMNSAEPPVEKKEVESTAATKEEVEAEMKSSSSSSHENSRRKSSSSSSTTAAKNSQGKRKVKVDWTPELHRRFVQAVEQLGVDKAVPSRILEIMGIDCLTRHNIASHLQKYRSHRKHLLAREAEAASLSQRRQMYAATAGAKREASPWSAPTIGFPPPPPPQVQAFRPLHVWGRPSFEAPLVPLWPPRHLGPRSPTPAWPPLPPPDPSYWHNHYQRGAREGWMAQPPIQGTPYFPQHLSTMSFPAPPPPLPGILPQPIYRAVQHPPTPSKHSGSPLQLDAHPSKESIDAAIGDALERPWLPLPLGLKPPSMDSVMVELQRQGISKVPPTCS